MEAENKVLFLVIIMAFAGIMLAQIFNNKIFLLGAALFCFVTQTIMSFHNLHE